MVLFIGRHQAITKIDNWLLSVEPRTCKMKYFIAVISKVIVRLHVVVERGETYHKNKHLN